MGIHVKLPRCICLAFMAGIFAKHMRLGSFTSIPIVRSRYKYRYRNRHRYKYKCKYRYKYRYTYRYKYR